MIISNYCVYTFSFCGDHIGKRNLYIWIIIIIIIIIIGLLGKYNKGRGAVEVSTPGKQNNANVVFYVYVYIFMGKLFIVSGELGSFQFIRMVNNKTIVLHLTRTYFCFFYINCTIVFLSLSLPLFLGLCVTT